MFLKNLQDKEEYSVVSCFIDFQDKYLLLKRAKKDMQYGLWGIPGGKLDKGELPEAGLKREIFEELNINIEISSLKLLGKMHLKNDCDGRYLLYIYHLRLDNRPEISINQKEHSEFSWVDIDSFKEFPLLFCQGMAFDYVKEKLLVNQKVKGEFCAIKT